MNSTVTLKSFLRSRSHSRRLALVGLLVAFHASLTLEPSTADIYQWEYINPADPSQGKQPSSTLAPDGAGLTAEPGASLAFRNLTKAYLIGADLSGGDSYFANLTNADLSHANLSNNLANVAIFTNATLRQANLSHGSFFGADFSGADLTGAVIKGGGFEYDSATGTGGLTLMQLYSAASYASHDLGSIGLNYADVSSADFSAQNLSSAGFYRSKLTGANFTNADVSYASFLGADLTGANFTGADVRHAVFIRDYFTGVGGISLAQLTATGSYITKDLSGIDLERNDLPSADFSGQNLSFSNFTSVNLDGADFSHANLTATYMASARIAGANFTGAEVRGALLSEELTAAQLASTASYAAHDLTGMRLSGTHLSGIDFTGQDLRGTSFFGAHLDGANFTNANIQTVTLGNAIGFTLGQLYTTLSYQINNLDFVELSNLDLHAGNFSHQSLHNATLSFSNLSGATFENANLQGATLNETVLSGASFRNANLESVFLMGSNLASTDFTGANVRFGTFARNSFTLLGGLTVPQLYSTASYQSHDLTGINLSGSDLSGINLANQNLYKSNFNVTTITNADFSHSNLTKSYFLEAVLSGVNLTAADLRGAQGVDLTGATTTNTILPDGHIHGLDLGAGNLLDIRNYVPDVFWIPGPLLPLRGDPLLTNGSSYYSEPAIPIIVDQHLNLRSGGILRLIFDAQEWGSTISFEPGSLVNLEGSLDLEFDTNVNLNDQIGRTFHIFDWEGVIPTGAFTISGPYHWDVSQLYSAGDITLTSIAEPSSWLLVAIALVTAVGSRRWYLRPEFPAKRNSGRFFPAPPIRGQQVLTFRQQSVKLLQKCVGDKAINTPAT